MKEADRHAWLIRLEPGGQFAGVYLFGGALPHYLDAYRCAAWRTRREAAAACRGLRETWPKARVLKMLPMVWREVMK